MKNIFLFLITALLSFSVSAGINIVGKGGGFAEMLFLKVDRSLSTHLASCLSNSNLCPLGQKAAVTAHRLIELLPQLQKKPIAFISECKNPQISDRSTALQVPSCLLYITEFGKPEQAIDLKEISVMVLAARALQAGLDAQGLEVIFADFVMQKDVYAVMAKNQRLLLHVITFEKNYYAKEKSMVLETPKASIDITLELKKALCPDSNLSSYLVSFDRNEVLDSKRLFFEGNIRWECSSNRISKARLRVSAVLTSELEIVANSLSIGLKQKENQ